MCSNYTAGLNDRLSAVPNSAVCCLPLQINYVSAALIPFRTHSYPAVQLCLSLGLCVCMRVLPPLYTAALCVCVCVLVQSTAGAMYAQAACVYA